MLITGLPYYPIILLKVHEGEADKAGVISSCLPTLTKIVFPRVLLVRNGLFQGVSRLPLASSCVASHERTADTFSAC